METASVLSHDQPVELSAIKAIELEAAKIPGAVSLAQGIPSFSTPKVITDYVKERISEGKCDKYSLAPGLPELRQAISLDLEKSGLYYDPQSEIIATCGSIEAITASLLGCTTPGSEVIVPSPTYVSYIGAIKLARCIPVFFELDEENNFDLQIDNIVSTITKRTRAIFYCNPNNPTGTIYSEKKTKILLDIAKAHNLIIITDEAYKDFYYSGDNHFTPALVPEAKERVIRICTFSKSYAMTGWRIGYLHTSAELAARIIGCHDSMVTCAPVASQYGAIAALKFAQNEPKRFCREYKKRRNLLLRMLDNLSHVFDYQMPKAAYFVFPRIKDTVPLADNSFKLAYDILEKTSLALVPGSAFGPSGESHLRISFSRDTSDVEEGISRLFDYFSNKNRSKKDTGREISVNHHYAPDSAVLKTANPLSSAIAATLGLCARVYLNRTKPLIVGIAGIRGKTVMKRIVTDMLKSSYEVRSSILSYNTETGLPLSILGLMPPKKPFEKIIFPAKLLYKTFFASKKANVLVLEYGIRSVLDAQKLLRIAAPDWLITAHLSGSDLSLDYKSTLEGISVLAKAAGRDRLLWLSSDCLTRKLGVDLNADLKIDPNTIVNSRISVRGRDYLTNLELPVESYKAGVLAGVMLCQLMGASESAIRECLASDKPAS